MTTGLFTLPLPAATADILSLRRGGHDQANCFFAGPENALVRTLVRLVDGPINSNSPLVLYGPRGVGKSCLALALAERRQKILGRGSVIVTTGADFARSLANAVEADSVADHRAGHQRCDLLVIDDLQRMANKPAAQQFLVSALDALQKRGSLVIITLNRLPQATAGFTAALVSRLLGGLVVRLALPGTAARRALARQAASRVNLPLDEQQLDRLVHVGATVTDHYLTAGKIRELVLRLAASHESMPAGDGPQESKALCRRAVTLVAKQCALPVSEIRGKSRRQAVADARALAMYLIRRLTAISYADVGRLFGNRDHTTVLHACRKVESQVGSDENIRALVEELIMQLGVEGAL